MNKSYQVIFNFLSTTEINVLINFIENHAVWEKGRQDSGYEKAVVSPESDLVLENLFSRSCGALGLFDEPTDCYILKYPIGSYIPNHKDPVAPGYEHWRLNAIIQDDDYNRDDGRPYYTDQPLSKLYLHYREIKLEQRDAIIFRPDIITHGVTPINGRTRYVWSVGALKKSC